MAISARGFPLRPPLFNCVRKVGMSSVAALERIEEPDNSLVTDSVGSSKAIEWKRLCSKELGIRNSMISKPTRIVLNGLKKKGFEVYLVGGCVRDLILKRTPKDFDILTSAQLKEVVKTFPRCEIVGRRFPICHVHIDDTFVEVSSFSTSVAKYDQDLSFSFQDTISWDEIRWKNCLQRDFTINGLHISPTFKLMFDPYAKIVYDYLGGLKDLRNAKVRTVGRASSSFVEDCARILRAVRIGARLGFRFTRETVQSVKDLSYLVLRLDRGRILMELNYMLAYGSAEASLRLLWRFGLLELLLPIQAAYFVQQRFRRRDERSNMLLSLFSNMDKLLAPDRPSHCSLWVGILAFHKALSDQPRDPLVVAAFSLAVHNGGDISEALKIATKISAPHEKSFYELLQTQALEIDELKDEVLDLYASVRRVLSNMTDEYFISQAMAKYSKSPYSDLVYIPLGLYLKVCKIFQCVKDGQESGFLPKQGSRIDYELLSLGSLQEVRHVFARIVFDTVFPLNSGQD